jgi:hypothetical protein
LRKIKKLKKKKKPSQLSRQQEKNRQKIEFPPQALLHSETEGLTLVSHFRRWGMNGESTAQEKAT